MKEVLNQLINHESLTKEQARSILINIASGTYNSHQVAELRKAGDIEKEHDSKSLVVLSLDYRACRSGKLSADSIRAERRKKHSEL